MRWLRDNKITFGLAAILVTQVGCISLTRQEPANGIASISTSKSHEPQLSKDQAIKASLAVAQNLDRSGDDAGAIDQYEKIQQLDPKDLHVARRLAILYDHRGD